MKEVKGCDGRSEENDRQRWPSKQINGTDNYKRQRNSSDMMALHHPTCTNENSSQTSSVHMAAEACLYHNASDEVACQTTNTLKSRQPARQPASEQASKQASETNQTIPLASRKAVMPIHNNKIRSKCPIRNLELECVNTMQPSDVTKNFCRDRIAEGGSLTLSAKTVPKHVRMIDYRNT